MRKILSLFIILLFSFSVFAQYEDEDVLTANNIKTHLTISSSFDIIKLSNNYKIDYVTVKLSYLPLESYRQTVISHTTSPKADETADYLLFNWERPPIGTEEFSSEYIIETYSNFFPIKNKVEFPLDKVPKEIIKYTQNTLFIDSNADIIRLANDIAQGKDDQYQIVFDAAVWVNNNIDYDLSTVTAQASLPSSWVLKNRKGVCDEMTNLFISILRSLGIPARFVSGISYTNSDLFDERWGPHGWAEVYFEDQGWVPFDPTYGQYGYVDASHIKLKESIDSDKSSIDYEWVSYEVKIEGNSPTNDVAILSRSDRFDSKVSIKVSALEDDIKFGSYNVITAKVSNGASEYRTAKLELVTPEGVDIDSKIKYVLLKPNEVKLVNWKVKFPLDLDKNSVYTFPVSIYDNFKKNSDMDISLNTRNIFLSEDYVDNYLSSEISEDNLLDINFYCDNKKIVDINEEFVITCTIEDSVNAKFCIKDVCKYPVNSIVSFTRSYDIAGAYPLIVVAQSNNKKKSYYSQVLVEDDPHVVIEWVDFDNTLDYSDSENIMFYLNQDSIAKPLDLSVSIEYNYNLLTLNIPEFEGTQLFQFMIKGKTLDTNNNSINVFVEFSDKDGKIYTQEFNSSIVMETNTTSQVILTKLNKFSNWIISLLQRNLN